MIKRTIDLALDARREPGWGRRLMLTGAALADRLEVSVLNVGTPVELTGVTGLAYFKTAQGDIPVACEVGGHRVAVEFPAEAYAFAGPLTVQVFLSDGKRNVPLYQEAFDIGEGRGDVLIDPGDIVPDLSALLALLADMSASKTACDQATGKADEAAEAARGAASAADGAAQQAESRTAEAVAQAQRATADADAAAQRAGAAAGTVEEAVTTANAASKTATEAAAQVTDAVRDAADAAGAANTAADRVDASIDAANTAAENANTKAAAAGQAASAANTAAANANAKAQAADEAAGSATAAAGAANTAASGADAARDRLEAVSLTVETLPAESDATGKLTKTDTSLVISLGVPRGTQGPQGPQGEQGPRGEQGPPGDIDNLPYATEAPPGAGTASAGSAATVARGDHVHPPQTSVSGNAGTATKLQTARKIGNASFDGSADISLAQIGGYAAGGIRTVALNLPLSAWTGGGPYTATISRADVTASTWVHLALDAVSMDSYSADLDWSTDTPGQIVLTTAVTPTGALAGHLILMEVG